MKQILFFLGLMLGTTGAWAQCNASFTAIVSGGNVALVNTSNASSNVNYYWSSTGGSPSSQNTYSTSDTAYVFYSTPGTYTVCIFQYDSNWSCFDSTCATVTITSSSLSSTTTSSNATCGSCNGSATVTPTGGLSPYSYSWSSGSTSATATNLCPGTYTVTVYDNNGDSTTGNVLIQGLGGNFNVIISASDTLPCAGDSVILDAQLGAPYTFLWSTGQTTPTIGVTVSGTYQVTVTDTNGCVVDDAITLGFSGFYSLNMSHTNTSCVTCCDGSATASVSGSGSFSYLWSNGSTTSTLVNLCAGAYTVTVSQSGSACTQTGSVNIPVFSCQLIHGNIAQGDEARVYLIQENSGVLSAVDSIDTDSGGVYYFYNVCPGTYYVKAALLTSHSQYASYVPTYYDSAALWSNATALIMTNSSLYGVDFSLLSGTNSGGPGFIGGLISQGANRTEGDPVVGAQVVAYNSDGSVARFAKTDASGVYNLGDLSHGTYTVHVDILNVTSYPYIVTIDGEHPSYDNRNFIVDANKVRPVSPTGVEDVVGQALALFPNPTAEAVTIQSQAGVMTQVSVYNLLGERVVSQPVPSTNSTELQLGHLAKGSYIVEILVDGQQIYKNVIVE